MEIFEEYNRVAPERGWKPLKSPRSLREWFNSRVSNLCGTMPFMGK